MEVFIDNNGIHINKINLNISLILLSSSDFGTCVYLSENYFKLLEGMDSISQFNFMLSIYEISYF